MKKRLSRRIQRLIPRWAMLSAAAALAFFLLLALFQGFMGLVLASRLAGPPVPDLPFALWGLGFCSGVTWGLLRGAPGLNVAPDARKRLAIWWGVSSFALLVLGLALPPISAAGYLGFWAIAGAIGTAVLPARLMGGRYGRILESDVRAMRRLVQWSTDLGKAAPAKQREEVVRIALERGLARWRSARAHRSAFSGPGPQDGRGAINLALALASGERAVVRAVLPALLRRFL